MTTPPQGPNPYGQPPYGQPPYGQQPYGQAPYPQGPQPPQAPYGPPPGGQPQGGPPQGGYAYPPQPQAPYGQQPQPGYPQAPQQPYPQGGAPVPPQPAPAPAKKSPKAILKGIVVAVGVIVIGVAWVSSWNDADTAKVGDCVKNEGNDIKPDLKVVDCGTAEATYKVTAVHANTTDTNLCPSGTVAYAETQHRRRASDTRFVLCLQKTK